MFGIGLYPPYIQEKSFIHNFYIIHVISLKNNIYEHRPADVLFHLVSLHCVIKYTRIWRRVYVHNYHKICNLWKSNHKIWDVFFFFLCNLQLGTWIFFFFFFLDEFFIQIIFFIFSHLNRIKIVCYKCWVEVSDCINNLV